MTPRDHETSTVDGAAGWERYHGDPRDDDRPTLREAEADERENDAWADRGDAR